MKTLSILIITTLILLGCGGSSDGDNNNVSSQGTPLPLSQNNLEILLNEINAKTNEISITPSQTQKDKEIIFIRDIYKESIEEDMGYSFDKTVRSFILFPPNAHLWVQTLYPVVNLIEKDPKTSLENNFITQRTFEIITLKKEAKRAPTKEQREFFKYVGDCQNINNGECMTETLLSIIKKDKLTNLINFDTKPYNIEMSIYNKYGIERIGLWLTKPDSTRINSTRILSTSDYKFILNKEQVALSNKLYDITQQEKLTLSQ